MRDFVVVGVVVGEVGGRLGGENVFVFPFEESLFPRVSLAAEGVYIFKCLPCIELDSSARAKAWYVHCENCGVAVCII